MPAHNNADARWSRLVVVVMSLAALVLGVAIGFGTAMFATTGMDEADEQWAAFRFMVAQSKYWEDGVDEPGRPGWANWQASLDVALQDGKLSQEQREALSRDLEEWEAIESCRVNGIARPPQNHGSSAPVSISPAVVKRFMAAPPLQPEQAAALIKARRLGLLRDANDSDAGAEDRD